MPNISTLAIQNCTGNFNSCVPLFCPDCPANAMQMGQATWAIWTAIEKYSLKEQNAIAPDINLYKSSRVYDHPILYNHTISYTHRSSFSSYSQPLQTELHMADFTI